MLVSYGHIHDRNVARNLDSGPRFMKINLPAMYIFSMSSVPLSLKLLLSLFYPHQFHPNQRFSRKFDIS